MAVDSRNPVAVDAPGADAAALRKSLQDILRTIVPMRLPNGLAGAASGKGGTITGFTVRPTDGLIYAADGVGLPRFGGAGTRNPAIFVVRRSTDSLVFLRAWYLLDMAISGLNSGTINNWTIQGLCWREANDRIYFVVQSSTASKIVEFSPEDAIAGNSAAAGVKSVIDFAANINGLTVDNINDQFLAGTPTVIRRRAIADFSTLGTQLVTGLTELDHLFHDKNTDRLYVSYGENGVAGNVGAYQCNFNMGSAVWLGSVSLPEAKAIEGLWRDSNELLVGNDAYYHNSVDDVNQIISYRSPPI